MRLLVSAIAGGIALVAAASPVAGTDARVAAEVFSPPDTPLILTRTLYRSLGDGSQIVASRRYAIRFSPDGDGFRLDGKLLEARVEAPPVLAGLARIEQDRPDTGLFPVWLDSHGMLRNLVSPAPDPGARAEALAHTKGLIERASLSPHDKNAIAVNAHAVASASRGSAWPVFLFNPGSAPRTASRAVTLPNGDKGMVEVRISAGELRPGGLPRRVERIIVTRVSGTARTVREVWTLEP